MADDTTVVDSTDSGFEPEPIPDNIADTVLDGLQPADESTDSEQVEDEPDETEQDQPDQEEEADDSGEPEEPEAEEEAESTEEAEPEQPDPKEVARQKFEERQAQKAQRNYVDEQRAKIRDYEQKVDPNDSAARLELLEAKQYVDTVERNRGQLINENLAAQAAIPMFNPNDKKYNEAAYTAAITNFNEQYVVTDPETGEVLGAQDRQGNNVSLRSYLQQQAAVYETLVNNTQRETRKAETKMRARVTTPSNPGKVTSSGDELSDLLDKIGDVPLN